MSFSFPTDLIPIAQYGATFPTALQELLLDLKNVPSVPPYEPAVDPLAAAVKVIARMVDHFPKGNAALQAHASEQHAVAHFQSTLEAHKLGDGTLWGGLIKWGPKIIAILQALGYIPTGALPTA